MALLPPVVRDSEREAEPLALEAHRINLAKMGPAHASTAAVRQLLERLYSAWGRPHEAAKYRGTRT